MRSKVDWLLFFIEITSIVITLCLAVTKTPYYLVSTLPICIALYINISRSKLSNIKDEKND